MIFVALGVMLALWLLVVVVLSLGSSRGASAPTDRSAQSVQPFAFGCVTLFIIVAAALIYFSGSRQ